MAELKQDWHGKGPSSGFREAELSYGRTFMRTEPMHMAELRMIPSPCIWPSSGMAILHTNNMLEAELMEHEGAELRNPKCMEEIMKAKLDKDELTRSWQYAMHGSTPSTSPLCQCRAHVHGGRLFSSRAHMHGGRAHIHEGLVPRHRGLAPPLLLFFAELISSIPPPSSGRRPSIGACRAPNHHHAWGPSSGRSRAPPLYQAAAGKYEEENDAKLGEHTNKLSSCVQPSVARSRAYN
ncbi:hypothetical protein Dimus_024276 [Dionaea muscipula]